MSAIFGEILTFGQAKGPEIRLRVTGDEHYATYETLDGYTAVSDSDRGQFCYAMLVNGVLVSSGYPVDGPPPVGVPRYGTGVSRGAGYALGLCVYARRTMPR